MGWNVEGQRVRDDDSAAEFGQVLEQALPAGT